LIRRNKSIWVLFAGIIIIIMLASSCGNSATTTTNPVTQAPTTQAQKTTTQAPTTQVQQTTKPVADSKVVLVSDKPNFMVNGGDAATNRGAPSQIVLMPVFEGLIMRDADNFVQPCLAESWSTPLTIYLLHLN
jgi:ABC-type transport system substrate-binding protein